MREPAQKPPDVREFLVGEDVRLDEELIPYEILCSEAHTIMLHERGLITLEDAKAMLSALEEAWRLWEAGEFRLDPELEDVHMNVESFVTERVGVSGEKLHTARSRNDLVQADTRMWMRDRVLEAAEALSSLVDTLLNRALEELETLMPAYTHFQPAQPTTLAHWMTAHAAAFLRDLERLDCLWERLNKSPLGAGAVSGTTLPIDRQMLAELLGFDGVQENTMDAVSSRGEVEAELLAVLSLACLHASRVAEDLVLWSNPCMGFVELPDEYCTGSSVMPQKGNPDAAELLRARALRTTTALGFVLNALKNLPTGYMRDMQETKWALFTGVEAAIQSLRVLGGMLSGAVFDRDMMKAALESSWCTATDLAELLVMKGCPFRSSYTVVKEFVSKGGGCEEFMSLCESMFGFRPEISEREFLEALNPESSVRKRVQGGPSPSWVSEETSRLRLRLEEMSRRFEGKRKALNESLERLKSSVRRILSS